MKRKPTKEQLYKLYVIDKHPIAALLTIFETSSRMMDRWFKEYGIEKRKPGWRARKQWFNK